MKRQDNKGILAFEKTRNIASAIYLVTDFIPERDPMRSKMREIVLEIVSVIVSEKGTIRSDFHLVGRVLQPRLINIRSLMEIANVAGFISDMNHKLITGEIDKLVESVSPHQKMRDVNDVLYKGGGDRFTNEDRSTRKSDNLSSVIGINRAGDSNGHSIGQSRTDYGGVKGQDNSLSEARYGRKELIMNELKRTDSMSVRDLVSVIKGVGEKTIQRDLISLTKDGLVRKTGEKRWSRYSLVNHVSGSSI